jgi:predicted  nucleic acid-binding Zn-ribbon protein
MAGTETLMTSNGGRDEQGQESPFDRLETKINSLIERYEGLQSDHRECSHQLAERETRIRQLEEQVRSLEQQRAEARLRLDGLIERITQIS